MSTRAFISQSKDPNTSRNASLKKDQIDLEKLDTKLKHISDKIIGQSPYILEIPTDRPYRPSSQQVSDWRKNTPFGVDEEELQYLSFVNRPADSGIIRAVGGWDNEKGEKMDAAAHLRDRASASNTPRLAGKKYSLADYKLKKAAGQPSTHETPKTNGAPHSHEKVHKSTTVEKPVVADKNQGRNRKRTSETMLEVESTPTATIHNEPQPPQKKVRGSPNPPTSAVDKSGPAAVTKLSLPRLLSPTLPSTIELELAKLSDISVDPKLKAGQEKMKDATTGTANFFDILKRPTKRDASVTKITKREAEVTIKGSGRSHVATSTSTSKLSPNQKTLADTKQPQNRQALDSDKDKLSRSNGILSSKHLPAASQKISTDVEKKSPFGKSDPKQKSLIVKLKIPRARRKDVARLLQTKPLNADDSIVKPKEDAKDQRVKREKSATTTEQTKTSKTRREDERGVAQEPSKSKEKRPRTDDEIDSSAPQSKRPKPLKSLDLSQKPTTPIPSAFKSPSLSQGNSTQKSSSNRRIDVSTREVTTPQATAKNGTPVLPSSVEKNGRNGRSASNTSSAVIPVKSDSLQGWKVERNRVHELAKSLKRESDALNAEYGRESQTPNKKRSMATAVETILCFLHYFLVIDELGRATRAPFDYHGWNSIFPLIEVVKLRLFDDTMLHGLMLQLEAVCREHLHVVNLNRLDHTSLPTALQAETNIPTPGSHGSSGKEAGGKPVQQPPDEHKDYIKFKSDLVDNSRRAYSNWNEGTCELSIEHLQESFPTTWKRRSVAPVKKPTLTKADTFSGDFYLPMSSITSGIEALRAGWSLLNEWCSKEGVDWTGRMG